MLLLILCGFLCLDGETAPIQKEEDTYLAQYTQTYLDLYYKSALAEWDANTKIIDGDGNP